MSVRFVYNKASEPLLARTVQMQAAMAERAELVAEAARSLGPRGDSEPHYVDMIEVAVGAGPRGAIARVNANKFTSHWIEFGTGAPGPTPAFAPLRRGAESVGLHLVAS